MKKMIVAISKTISLKRTQVPIVCQAWEDNKSVLKHTVSPFPKVTPKTKHIGVKFHWFRGKLKANELEVHPIRT